MSSIYIDTSFIGIVFIILIFTIKYFIKKKRDHKDFYSTVIFCFLFSILALYLLTINIIDIFNYHLGKFHTAEGNCEIYYFEPDARDSGHYDIWIGDLGLTADINDFSFLKEETTACKATYLKATGTLIDIELK